MPTNYIRYAYASKALTSLWGKRMQIIRIFQENLGSFGLCRFVAEETEDQQAKQLYDRYLEMLIDAYINFVTLPALLSCFGEQIEKSTYLDEYFSKFEYYLNWKESKKQGIMIHADEDVLGTIWGWLITGIGAINELARITQYMSNPFAFFTQIFSSLFDDSEKRGYNEYETLQRINQEYGGKKYPIELAFVNPGFWQATNPALTLDWAVIRSCIFLLKTYKNIEKIKRAKGVCPPFIPYLPVQLILTPSDQITIIDNKDGTYTFLHQPSGQKLKVKRDKIGRYYIEAVLDKRGRTSYEIPCQIYDNMLAIEVEAFGFKGQIFSPIGALICNFLEEDRTNMQCNISEEDETTLLASFT